MDSSYSLSDIKSVVDGNEYGMGSWIWILLFFVLWSGNGNFGLNRNDAVTNEVLTNQHFNALDARITNLGNGICDSTYALNNTILTEGRALQTQVANCCCDIRTELGGLKYDNAMNTQKILDAICGNRMADMQNQINQLQLQAAMCNVVRYPSATTFNAGFNPFCHQSCGCTSI